MSKPKTSVPPHPFQADPELPADRGRHVCARCHLIGQPGDAHHTMPEPIADGQQLAAGERSDR